MTVESYRTIKTVLASRGYADEFKWAQNVKPCADADTFYQEACWVIINGGMKEQVARLIWQRIRDAWEAGKAASEVFGHSGKSAIIQKLRTEKDRYFSAYCDASDKMKFLRTIPFIGPITVYHLARNLGLNFAKPDRHLERIASLYGESPQEFCERLSKASGDRIGAVDAVIWRAANLKLL